MTSKPKCFDCANEINIKPDQISLSKPPHNKQPNIYLKK